MKGSKALQTEECRLSRGITDFIQHVPSTRTVYGQY